MTTASIRPQALVSAREPSTEPSPPSLRSFALAAVGTVARYPAEDVAAIISYLESIQQR